MLKPRIKVRLAELNIKQQELSDYMGVTKQTMSLWVNGKALPSLESSFKMAMFLKCKVDDLFLLDEH